MPSRHLDDVRLAHLLADDADSLTMSRFRAQDLHVSTKPDHSFVSDADTTVEEMIRRTLSRARPRDAVVGEEIPDTGYGTRRWVVDPIDGTHNYVRGVPVWATLIALMEGDEVVAGVVSAPALGRRWWASKGDGAHAGKNLMHARACRVSSVSRLADAQLSYSDLEGWQRLGRLVPFLDVMRRCWRTRGFGDFWSYMLLAEGSVEIATEPSLELYDMAACAIIVTEAGGRFSDLSGADGPNGGNALATNSLLHEEVLGLIGDAAVSEKAQKSDVATSISQLENTPSRRRSR
jgi:histidinol-phosphatase